MIVLLGLGVAFLLASVLVPIYNISSAKWFLFLYLYKNKNHPVKLFFISQGLVIYKKNI
jgi:hypothetical protein